MQILLHRAVRGQEGLRLAPRQFAAGTCGVLIARALGLDKNRFFGKTCGQAARPERLNSTPRG